MIFSVFKILLWDLKAERISDVHFLQLHIELIDFLAQSKVLKSFPLITDF